MQIRLLSLLVCMLLGGAAFAELPPRPDLVWDLQRELTLPLKPDNEKKILWHDKAGVKTPWSIVYIHGFSASRHELSPVVETLARGMGANVYYTRLAGHGRDGEALANVSVGDWQNDARIALGWGRELGNQVLLVASSTGAALALWLAHRYDAEVDGLVLLSPNFGPKDRRGQFLLWPGGKYLARLIIGEYREWEPRFAKMHRYWQCRYPVEALVTMMGAVAIARDLPFAEIKQPVFMAYAPDDEILDLDAIVSAFRRLGGEPKKLLAFPEGHGHMLAGMAAPEGNKPLLREIWTFLRTAEIIEKSSLPPSLPANPAAP